VKKTMSYFNGIGKVMFILPLLFVISCAGQHISSHEAPGVYHRVKKGETLSIIAHAYKVNVQYLAEVNNIDNVELIEAGRAIFIPDARQVLDDILPPLKGVEPERRSTSKREQAQKKPVKKEDVEPLPKGGMERKKPPPATDGVPSEKNKPKVIDPLESEKRSEQEKAVVSRKKNLATEPEIDREEGFSDEQTKIKFDKKRFIWPAQGKVISRFGIQPNGMFFNGIKIAAPESSPVVAAAEGTVIFSAPFKDYGETVILKHDDNYATVYSNLGQRLVKKDDHLKKGDRIGILAKPEQKGDAVVHFEIRQNNKARNPVFYLP
jgi:lipoprotein NlpD